MAHLRSGGSGSHACQTQMLWLVITVNPSGLVLKRLKEKIFPKEDGSFDPLTACSDNW